MTTLDDRPVTDTAAADTGVLTRGRVIEQFRIESGCSERTARRVLHFLVCVAFDPLGFHHLDDDEIRTIHPVLDRIIPDDTAADPGSGSAHDLANRHCIPDNLAGGRQFRHTKSRFGPQTYCTVLLELV